MPGTRASDDSFQAASRPGCHKIDILRSRFLEYFRARTVQVRLASNRVYPLLPIFIIKVQVLTNDSTLYRPDSKSVDDMQKAADEVKPAVVPSK